MDRRLCAIRSQIVRGSRRKLINHQFRVDGHNRGVVAYHALVQATVRLLNLRYRDVAVLHRDSFQRQSTTVLLQTPNTGK